MALPLDETLARRSRGGDGAAVFELGLRHWKIPFRVALNLLVRDPVAVAEEALARAIGSAGSFEDAVPFRLSLMRAAVEASLSRLDALGERAPSRPPDEGVEKLRRLTPTDRACLALCDGEELTAEEAAFVLRTTPRIVRIRAHHARLRLAGFGPEIVA